MQGGESWASAFLVVVGIEKTLGLANYGLLYKLQTERKYY